MTTNDKKTPLDSIITKEYIETLTTGNEVLKNLVTEIEETYKQVFNKTYDESLYIVEENVYYVDQHLMREFVEIANTKGSTTLDVILELYLGWTRKTNTQLNINARHYHKNKIIKTKLDDLILSIIPNAKVVASKIDIFLAKANDYLKSSSEQEKD